VHNPRTAPVPERSVDQLADADDLRSAIAAAIAAPPVDEHALRRAVWTYVGAERHAGASPGQVIAALSQMIETGTMTDAAARLELVRRVILWSVEAYFGHLGGVGVEHSDAERQVVEPAADR
jgi:hypothetical protein